MVIRSAKTFSHFFQVVDNSPKGAGEEENISRSLSPSLSLVLSCPPLPRTTSEAEAAARPLCEGRTDKADKECPLTRRPPFLPVGMPCVVCHHTSLLMFSSSPLFI